MVYNVEVKVEAIRHMTVEAATVEEAEEIGLKEAIDLVGGIDGTVLGVWSDPKKFIDEAEQLGLQEAKALVGGIDGTVLEVYSDPKQLIGEEHAD